MCIFYFVSIGPLIILVLTSCSALPTIAYLTCVLPDFSLTVKAATVLFISRCGSAISSAKQGKSGFIYNLVKS